MKLKFFTILIFLSVFISGKAQNENKENPYAHYLDSIYSQDSIPLISLPNVYVFPKVTFKNPEEEKKFNKLVRDVKKTLPYAKLIYDTLLETYEFLETIPNKKEKEKHLKRMENELFAEYKPVLKDMTYSQGRLLIKLIDRECNQSSYALIKVFLGKKTASFWQGIGLIFNVNLKTEYDPKGEDKVIEEVIQMVEAGVL